METKFCRVLISAPNKQEANLISKTLVSKKLVAGTIINNGNCHYWWKEEVIKKEYYNIQAFSLINNKEEIISEVKKIHSDKCPIVAFMQIDGNEEFLEWIEKSLK
ncbi:MAG: divalent cation tolerance protein CutA [Candidatus Woesearchaeota archaeon]